MWTSLRKTLYRARGYLETDLAGQRFRLDPYHSTFWRKAAAGRWEPETFATLAAHLTPDCDYLDIGAWIGPTVLYGARHARRVIALEPDPVAFRALSWNVELNAMENVSALPLALADRVGVMRMAGMRGERGDSTTSLLNPGGEAGSDVVTMDWQTFADARDLSGVGLAKIDVEGAEFGLVPQMAGWLEAQRPALLLSTHAPWLAADERAGRMRALVDALGFYARWQRPDGEPVDPAELRDGATLDRFDTLLLKG
ncbi:FkbM family methyltransferase [Marinibacterium sp. SX1]|uniref:FkbM family methyltransferase n=1 Tax=Marinibacterium sp. SX1 TaxID=3388424 RepID=UPI003D185356